MYFDQAKFGCRLRTLRKRRRMTQETLAGALNISIDHLSKIEHGKRGVSIDLLLDISEAVDTSLDYTGREISIPQEDPMWMLRSKLPEKESTWNCLSGMQNSHQ